MRLTTLFLIGLIVCPVYINAQIGIGLDLTPSVGETKSTHKNKKLKNPFTFHLAEHMELDYIELRKLQKRGYGRIELIKLILISQQAELPLKDMVTKRDTFEKIKSIAETYNVDYAAIRKESKKIKTIVEKNITESPVTEEEPKLLKGEEE